ncbi:MAG: hypothetical protein KKH12_15920 [Gammaproteobacteria bacterium]|nr:hypothetical protein [Gammaproteobacteria bacterium]
MNATTKLTKFAREMFNALKAGNVPDHDGRTSGPGWMAVRNVDLGDGVNVDLGDGVNVDLEVNVKIGEERGNVFISTAESPIRDYYVARISRDDVESAVKEAFTRYTKRAIRYRSGQTMLAGDEIQGRAV